VNLIKTLLLYFVLVSLVIKPGHAIEDSITMKDESRGTTIFFEWLDDRFILATDSFQTNGKNGRPDNNDCKIVFQGKENRFFTVSGGIRTFTLGEVKWDTQRTAETAYRMAIGAKEPEKVAQEWKRRSLEQLNSLPPLNSVPLSTRLRLKDLPLNRILFAGLRADGSLDVRTIRFLFDGNKYDMKIETPEKNQILPLAEGIESADEFQKQDTPQSKQEYEKWRSSLDSAFHVWPVPELKTQYLIELVQFVINHHRKDEQIDGVVEAVQLQPHSTIKWLRKCPTN
jgi:hypothetical protein